MNRKQRRAAGSQGKTATGQGGAQRLFAEALQLHRGGRLADAEKLYRQILTVEPGHAGSLDLLGGIAFQTGRPALTLDLMARAIAGGGGTARHHSNMGLALKALGRRDEAVACFRRAITLQPDSAEALGNLGVALQEAGQFDEAVTCCRRAIAAQADFAEAHSNLGAALTALGRFDEAVASCRQAATLLPDSAEIHNNLGAALKETGRLDEAVGCYRRAVALVPGYAEAHNNLGVALRALGRFDEAAGCCRRAVELRPGYAEAHNSLANVLKDLGRLDEALAGYRQAIALKPDYAEAHSNLAGAFTELGRPDEAVAACRQALDLWPDYPEALCNLGNALRGQGLLGESVAPFRRAVLVAPSLAEAHSNLGDALLALGRLDEAVTCFRRAVEIDPDFALAYGHLVHQRHNLCDWQDIDRDDAELLALVTRRRDGVAPFPLLSLPAATAADQLAGAEVFGDRHARAAQRPLPPCPRPAGGRMRIGYLSADFGNHPVACLIVEMIERHDRDRFEVVGYSIGPDDDSPMRRRLTAGFERFVDLRRLSHRDAALAIQGDGIDVLVDLNGYTSGFKPGILAHRPAPVQVSFLGYPATMGVDFIDYAIVDRFLVPADQQSFWRERLVRLPDVYQPSDTRRTMAPPPRRADCGLPEDGVVFCSFNNAYKFTPAMFGLWMRLLAAVPGSVLWLFAANPGMVGNLRREAAARGVDASRLVFADRVPGPEYLARLAIADLFLDTAPYNAGATANDALWAGLPVLTLAGETYVGRMAGSLLTAIGLPELIAGSEAEYEALALRLARDRGLLGEMRARLAANRETAPLFDIRRYTGNIEAAYRRMGEIRNAGNPPEAFDLA